MKSAIAAAAVILALATSALPVLSSVAMSATQSAVAPSACEIHAASGCGPLPPAPVSGPPAISGGCTVPDPSGTGGCVTPTLANLMHQVRATFGPLPVSCWSARGGDPYSDHPQGRACDYTFGRIGSYPGSADVARGWTLALWLRVNATTLNVSYVIWQGRIWSRVHDSEGWRPYTGGGYYSTSGPTNAHYDHVHASVE